MGLQKILAFFRTVFQANKQSCSTLTAAEVAHLKGWPVVCILPFAQQQAVETDTLLGIGISRIVQKELTTVQGISVLGAEDTPTIFRESVSSLPHQQQICYVSGQLESFNDSLRLELDIYAPDKPAVLAVIHESDHQTLLNEAVLTIARVLQVSVTQQQLEYWATVRPKNAGEYRAVCAAAVG